MDCLCKDMFDPGPNGCDQAQELMTLLQDLMTQLPLGFVEGFTEGVAYDPSLSPDDLAILARQGSMEA